MINGVINQMWTKNVEVKRGPRAGQTSQVHLFSLGDGDENVYSLGFGTPDVKTGDDVSFNAEEKYGEQQVDKRTLKINSRGNKTTAPASPAKPTTASGKGGYSRGTFPLDFTDGQRSILRQHAFTQASEIARWYPVEAESPDDFLNKIIDLAYKIEKYSSGDDLREEMKEDE